jgi:hypothetical protein
MRFDTEKVGDSGKGSDDSRGSEPGKSALLENCHDLSKFRLIENIGDCRNSSEFPKCGDSEIISDFENGPDCSKFGVGVKGGDSEKVLESLGAFDSGNCRVSIISFEISRSADA